MEIRQRYKCLFCPNIPFSRKQTFGLEILRYFFDGFHCFAYHIFWWKTIYSCFYFKEQSDRLLPSFHTTRFRLVCQIYLLGQNGKIVKAELLPIRSNILLVAISHYRTYHYSGYSGSQSTKDFSE
jgi:hypothetical protein